MKVARVPIILLAGLIVLCVSPVSAQERWIYRYDGPGNSDDEAYSIVAGPDGNLYAAGLSRTYETYSDLTVVSLTPSGDERWVYRYNGPGSGWNDGIYSVAVGVDGNLYAAAWSSGNGTYEDFTVVSLTPSGEERWVYRYDGPRSYQDGG